MNDRMQKIVSLCKEEDSSFSHLKSTGDSRVHMITVPWA